MLFTSNNTTVDETKCPETYLHLLSLYDVHDGFLLLHNLTFHHSPQLHCKYRDFRNEISNLAIFPGEHISKFYQRTIKLFHEITLSKLSNGNSTELCYRFLELLWHTGCPTIQGITHPYWKLITTHHRNPNHPTAPLPQKSSDITILPDSKQPPTSSYDSTNLFSPIAAAGSSISTRSAHHNNNNLVKLPSSTYPFFLQWLYWTMWYQTSSSFSKSIKDSLFFVLQQTC